MKKIFFTILSIALSLSIFAQTDITPKVAESIKSGNATQLASYFMAQIELTIEETEGTFSKAEAEKKLAAFFASHGVTGFEIKHQGTSKLDDQYRIGDLVTKNGTFRVTFFIRKNGNALQIKQLKIEVS
jgi:Domain of unknown function (DUF4783)